ncbi:type II secretion system F family protein [Neptunomonas antarctica]|uniref:MSHA biogenesis protein MshG n=1 Tax=Neptunomonas antarctica TaxID=619304 RepID=A0A1N7MNN1_9GAMM|nr:type II secretion system F family protein [Neptunomonas antarctica]SIS87479.1 MSHA biogenesis protein MshG [Neptunomonas antarctica]
MAAFQYSGRHSDGSAATGRIEALSKAAVATQLLEQGITPVKVEIASQSANEKKTAKNVPLRLFERVSLDELIMFSRQIASLTRAGVPITSGMRGLANTIRNPLLERTLHTVADDLERGNSLSSTLNKHPKLFNDLYVSMVHVGENTGRLDEAFSQMASYLDLERKTTRSLKQATRYPMFVMIAISIAIGVINVFVIPAFKSVFESFGGNMPWQTRVLITISDFFVNWWYLVLATLITSGYLFVRWKKTENGRRKWDQIKLRFPLVGGIFYRAILGRFARTFSVVLKAGIPIEQGLSIVSRAMGNVYIGEKVADMRKGIERGEGFTATAHRTNMFSPLVMQMLSVGEETGRVDEMLEDVANFYEEEVEYNLQNLSSVIEPILIVAIGIMVLVLALGVFLPLWELSTTING